jgi:hypothetical protein
MYLPPREQFFPINEDFLNVIKPRMPYRRQKIKSTHFSI